MVEKKFGAIAVLDALGTKGIWQRRSPEQVVQTWDYLMNVYQKVHDERTKMKDGYESVFRSFSDTIIITASGDDNVKTLVEFGVDLGILFTQSALNKLFMRGSISVGEFYVGEKIIIGPAIDEAAQYHTLPQWVGISVGPSAYNILQKQNPKTLLEFGYSYVYLPYQIPTKIGFENGFALNLPLAYDAIGHTFKKDLQMDVPDSLTELLECELEGITDIEASFKIRNTLNFINYANEINKDNEPKHS